MPLEFDKGGVDLGGVVDQRGRGGGGMAIGGGASLVGVVIYFLFQALTGQPVDVGGALNQIQQGQSQNSTGTAESTEDLAARCNAEGALAEYTDCRLIKVYNIADDVWRDEFARLGVDYRSPRLNFFSGSTNTACGAATASVGPFYCPGDEGIYFDLDFLAQLQQQFGAPGEFAQAYIAAHEFGHHLQTVLGTERKVRAAQQQNPGLANQYSIAMELQADCYAGVWSKLADQRAGDGIVLDREDVQEAMNAAAAVGDDRIQEKTQGRVDPEGWTHGSSDQRMQWFDEGYANADVNQCNTFARM